VPIVVFLAVVVIALVIWSVIDDRSEHRARNRELSMEEKYADSQIANKDKSLGDVELDEFLAKRLGSGKPKGSSEI
jgi:hypothetical protein